MVQLQEKWSGEKRSAGSQLVNITQHHISSLQVWHANITQPTPSTAASGCSERRHCFPNAITAIWGMGRCEKASALRKLSNITRCLGTGPITSPGSPNSIRSTGAPAGHQLGTKLQLSWAQSLAPEKHGKETFIQSCTMLSHMFHNPTYPRPLAPLKKTALAMQSQ